MSSASAAAVDVAWKERANRCCCCCCPRPSGTDDDDTAACRSFNSSLLLVAPRTIVVDFIIFAEIYLQFLSVFVGLQQHEKDDRLCCVFGNDGLSLWLLASRRRHTCLCERLSKVNKKDRNDDENAESF